MEAKEKKKAKLTRHKKRGNVVVIPDGVLDEVFVQEERVIPY